MAASARSARWKPKRREPDFWDDPAGAQAQMQRLNTLKESLAPWQAVRKRLDDARTLAELALMEDDPEAYAPELQGETGADHDGAGQAGSGNAAVRPA